MVVLYHVRATPGGSVSPAPGGPYSMAEGGEVVLSATPSGGYRLKYYAFSNGLHMLTRANRNYLEYTMFSNFTVTAVFEPTTEPQDHHFAVFDAAGVIEYVCNPQPLKASWEPTQVGETATRTPIYDFYKKVRWEFGNDLKSMMSSAMFGQFVVNRVGSTGVLYLRTADDTNPPQFNIVKTKCSPRPGGSPVGNPDDPVWIGVNQEFWSVEPFTFS